MNAAKTANALMVYHNYQSKGMNPILLKPRTDTRDGEKIIKSRTGMQAPCEFVEDFKERSNFRKEYIKQYDAIIIDEVQFLSELDIDWFSSVTEAYNIPVLCYGLRTDFRTQLFPGSKRLFEIADELNEITTVCWCGRKARFNARIHNGNIVRSGEQVMIGGNESYVSLCRHHYMSNEPYGPNEKWFSFF